MVRFIFMFGKGIFFASFDDSWYFFEENFILTINIFETNVMKKLLLIVSWNKNLMFRPKIFTKRNVFIFDWSLSRFFIDDRIISNKCWWRWISLNIGKLRYFEILLMIEVSLFFKHEVSCSYRSNYFLSVFWYLCFFPWWSERISREWLR